MARGSRFAWHGKEVMQRLRAAAADGLFDGAEHILEEANRTVPLDEGPLMQSGQTDVDRERLEATVSYDTPYARRQHEELSYRHAPGRRAKWLELTVQERERAVQEYVAGKIRQALKG